MRKENLTCKDEVKIDEKEKELVRKNEKVKEKRK